MSLGLRLRLGFLLSATWCGSRSFHPLLPAPPPSPYSKPRLIISNLRGFCAGLITKRVTLAWIIQGYPRYVPSPLRLWIRVHLSVHFYCPSCTAEHPAVAQVAVSLFFLYYSIKKVSTPSWETQHQPKHHLRLVSPHLAGNTICGLGLGSRLELWLSMF